MEIAKLIYFKNKVAEMYQTDPNYKKMVDDLVLSSESFNKVLDKIRQNPTQYGIDPPKQSPITQIPIPPPANTQEKKGVST